MKIKKLFLIANIRTALLFLVTCAACSLAHAQYCNPALVSYIVRDENGKPLTVEALKSVAEQLPKSIGDAQIYAGEVSLTENGRHFYRQESVDWDKGEKVPALHFINDGNCAMRLGKVTLTYQGKQMRLTFNLSITRTQDDRRWVIDSLPFQEGSFEVDVSGWPWEKNEVVSADRWKAAPDLTPDQPHAPQKIVTVGAKLGAKTKRPRGGRVRSARGLTGYFVSPCGGLCPTLSWVESGYIYTVGIHAAEHSAHRKVANSAIDNGVFSQ